VILYPLVEVITNWYPEPENFGEFLLAGALMSSRR
jgi:hypothetical protein